MELNAGETKYGRVCFGCVGWAAAEGRRHTRNFEFLYEEKDVFHTFDCVPRQVSVTRRLMLLVHSQTVISQLIGTHNMTDANVVTFPESFCEGRQRFACAYGVIHSVDKVWEQVEVAVVCGDQFPCEVSLTPTHY